MRIQALHNTRYHRFRHNGLLDLLQKSFEFEIVERSDQIEA
jgi:hypothetical protein